MLASTQGGFFSTSAVGCLYEKKSILISTSPLIFFSIIKKINLKMDDRLKYES